MERIRALKKPPPSLVKLVECVGILLSCPKSYRKSNYKAPIPSNYQAALDTLAEDFYGKLAILSEVQSEDIDNEKATEFFSKMLEPGVDYEDAVNVGGLVIRELFNIALLVLLKLQNDPLRVPVAINNVLAVVDGSRASYVALDTAAHICRHGTLNVFINTDKQHIVSLLENDVARRCKNHFKLQDHQLAVHSPFSDTLADTFASNLNGDFGDVTESMVMATCCAKANCGTIVVPYSESLGSFRFISEGSYHHWASWVYTGDVVFAKNMSFVRPFSEISCSRTFIVYVDAAVDAAPTLLKALKYFRPGDNIVVTTVFASRDPVGDNRQLRFDFGERQQWIRSDDELSKEASRVGWNDEIVEAFTASMYELIQKSNLAGNVRIERSEQRRSVADIICSVAREENAMGIMMRLQGNEETLTECLADHPFTLFVLK